MTIATKTHTHDRLRLAGVAAGVALAIAQDQTKPTAADIRTQVMAARSAEILKHYLEMTAGQMPEHPINPERNTFADLKKCSTKSSPPAMRSITPPRMSKCSCATCLMPRALLVLNPTRNGNAGPIWLASLWRLRRAICGRRVRHWCRYFRWGRPGRCDAASNALKHLTRRLPGFVVSGDQNFNDLLDTPVAKVPKLKVTGIEFGWIAIGGCRQCFAQCGVQIVHTFRLAHSITSLVVVLNMPASSSSDSSAFNCISAWMLAPRS